MLGGPPSQQQLRQRQAAGSSGKQQQQPPGAGAVGAAAFRGGGGGSGGGMGPPPYGAPGQAPLGVGPMSRGPPPPLPPVLLDATTAKLMLPSRAALHALLALPLVLWAAAVVLGALHAEELPEGTTKRDFEHPLSAFDRHVFRVWGPLLPLAPYLVRVAALSLRMPLHSRSPASSATGGPVRRLPLRPGATLALPALSLYGVVIVVRIVLYVSHVALQRGAELFLVSDHLLLAASVVACFQCELVLCLSDAYKAELLAGLDPSALTRQAAAVAAMVCSMFVLVFVYGDMYCTARWYHHPAESLGALVAGALLFQAPVLVWLLRRASKPPGRV